MYARLPPVDEVVAKRYTINCQRNYTVKRVVEDNIKCLPESFKIDGIRLELEAGSINPSWLVRTNRRKKSLVLDIS